MSAPRKSRLKVAVRSFLQLLAMLLWGTMALLRRRKYVGNQTPRRILVVNSAHIGDLIISTSLIPVLRSAFPSVEIGFATGSWSLPVVTGHPEIDFVHAIDHWALNRSNKGLLSKFHQHAKTHLRALREIRAVGYDAAVCLFNHYNADGLNLVWQAGIPRRIGLRGSFRAPLGTDLVTMSNDPFRLQGELHADLLRPLGIEAQHLLKRKSILAPSTVESFNEVCTILGVEKIEATDYCIVHIGSGAVNRQMPVQFWKDLIEELPKTRTILLTGRGARENADIEQISAGKENCINACGKLSWQGFVTAVSYAGMVFGVESMAGHVAAATGTPSRVVYSGVAGVARWRPESNSSIVFTNHVVCAPCYDIRGCDAMNCIKGINPVDLIVIDSLISIKTATDAERKRFFE